MPPPRPSERRRSPAHSPAFQPPHCRHAGPLPHVHGLSPARSTTGPPPHPRPSAGDGPTHPQDGSPRVRVTVSGSRVQRVVDRPGRRPALPRQPRHTYAAVLRCGLPTGVAHPASELIPPEAGSRTAPGPYPPDLKPAPDLRGVHHWFARTTPSGLARRARAVWQSQHDPALSGLLPPAPASPGPGFPQLQSGRCDDPMVKASHLHTTTRRFTADRGSRTRVERPRRAIMLGGLSDRDSRSPLAGNVVIRGRDTVLGTHRRTAHGPGPG